MAKQVWIQFRVKEETKAAIQAAAKTEGRTVSNWLIYVAALYDDEIAKTAGLRS